MWSYRVCFDCYVCIQSYSIHVLPCDLILLHYSLWGNIIAYIFVYYNTLWQASHWHLTWYHLLECIQTTMQLLTQTSATTSTLELPSPSAAAPLTQVMTSLCPSTRTGWWSVMGTWRTQHWQRQPLQPPRSLYGWSSSTSNQSMTVSTTALPVQVTQMKSCPVTCTSMGQVRTACVCEVDVPCIDSVVCWAIHMLWTHDCKRHGALTEGYLDAAEVNAACLCYWLRGIL